MRRTGLSFQVNLIFSFVIIFASGLFIFILNAALNKRYFEQSLDEVEKHYEQISLQIQHYGEVINYDVNYLGYAYKLTGIGEGSHNIELINELNLEKLINMMPIGNFNPEVFKNLIVKGRKLGRNNYVVVFYDVGLYTNTLKGNTQLFMISAFINIILLGNIVIWLWSSSLLKRIKGINSAVKAYSNQDYDVEIDDQGFDEIKDLSEAINEMRLTIKETEMVKRRMLQNISHDLKTPIAVIQNYAEAIQDGQIPPSDAKIILKHTKLLTDKANKLLELTKLESLTIEIPDEPIIVKDYIEKIIDEYYTITHANIKMDLDDSKYYINPEYFEIILTNILDNACRYVNKDIEIVLKNKKLTIYNDGEAIDESFISKIFNPYEKGAKGQFGLGLAIVSQTLAKFNLTIKVENINNGVMFTIVPK